jgi:glutathione synthase/RimK-type ligase-like ATP-grasp enzyme
MLGRYRLHLRQAHAHPAHLSLRKHSMQALRATGALQERVGSRRSELKRLMTNDPEILILSTIVDPATDDVATVLESRGIPFVRINTENYPFSDTLTFWPDHGLSSNNLQVSGQDLSSFKRVWYRRLRAPSRPENMDEGIYTFCLQETRATLLGSIMGLHAKWMSFPVAVWKSEFKPYQLQLASELGLPIPPTVITNDPHRIRDAYDAFGQMIVKPVRTGYVVHDRQELAVYTSQVLPEHLEHLESARLSPSIYQKLIPKKFDIRVTIVGDRVFAAAIDSQSDAAASIDWRMTENPQLPHLRIELPNPLISILLRLMKALDLSFGAIDLIQTTDDEYFFLEINPNGQWLWLDDMLDLGISNAVTDWLVGAECN